MRVSEADNNEATLGAAVSDPMDAGERATHGFAMAARRLAISGHVPSEDFLEMDPLWLPVAVLWERFLRFDPGAPAWRDRDRFLVSSARMKPLSEAFLRLTGSFGAGNDLALGACATVDIPAGLAGQVIATGAGMALAERVMSEHFGKSLVGHRTWVAVGAADLQTGFALEAAALSVRHGLSQFTLLVALDTGNTALTVGLERFQATGWAIRRVMGDNVNAIVAAMNWAQRSKKPALLVFEGCAVFDEDDAAGMAESSWGILARRGLSARRGWLRRLARHRQKATFEKSFDGHFPEWMMEDWQRTWMASRPHFPSHLSIFDLGLQAVRLLRNCLPTFVCLSASMKGLEAEWSDNSFDCGAYEPAMVGLLTGLALHGGVPGCCVVAMGSVDRIRPALRFAAMTRQGILCILVEGAAGPGGEIWPPVEQLASLRAIPGLAVFRPSGASEVEACWSRALTWRQGPSVLVLSQEKGDRFSGRTVMGGYVLTECDEGMEHRDVTLLATGTEVRLAVQIKEILSSVQIRTAVVSVPCWEWFSDQPEAERRWILGNAPRVAIEAASGFGWERWIGAEGLFVGVDEYAGFDGVSAQETGFTWSASDIADRIVKFLEKKNSAPVRKNPHISLAIGNDVTG
jgi:transketolase